LFDQLIFYLVEPEIPFVFSNVDATEQSTVYLKISVSADHAINTSEPGGNNPADSTVTATDAASETTPRRPTNDLPIVGGTPALAIKEGPTEMSPTENILRGADQAMGRMQPAPGSVAATAEDIMTVSAAVDSVASTYRTWEKAVESIKLVVGIVDKVAEVIV
jgi:hypothetical protein